MKNTGRTIIMLLVILAILGGGLYYLASYTEADALAVEAMKSDSAVTVADGIDYISFIPRNEIKGGFIYYQGGKVDVNAFSYAARKISEQGYFVALIRSGLNLAITDINAAGQIISDHPEIDSWVVSGFSLGGVAACSYARDNDELVDGVVLFASYPNGSMSEADVNVLSISGSNDGLCLKEDIDNSKANLPSDAQFVVIEGGNHTGFALYGGDGFVQMGDNAGTINKLEQQEIVIDLVLNFLEENIA